MGVSCRTPNSFACDRVGLAVWLREPAVRVDAAIADQELEPDDPEWSGPAEDGERRMFAGFLQPAGLIDGPLQLTPDAGPIAGSAASRYRSPSSCGSSATTARQPPRPSRSGSRLAGAEPYRGVI
jgi:hypothetical protein